jgi:hypothetical protein
VVGEYGRGRDDGHPLSPHEGSVEGAYVAAGDVMRRWGGRWTRQWPAGLGIAGRTYGLVALRTGLGRAGE